MAAYYNDHDPEVCEWLRELIRAGLIADGEVDERSILDVRPDDLRGFIQCHFFAGVGGWSYALRLAGIPDDLPVWTGSPPCQPFSTAGQRKGRDDARHLGPHFVSLVGACRPPLLFGEQVASSDVFGKAASRAAKAAPGQPAWAWVDDLCDRLEASRYAVGAGDIPAAGVGAPHIRQRCFFGAVRLADGDDAGLEGRGQPGRERAAERAAGPGGVDGGLGNGESWRERSWVGESAGPRNEGAPRTTSDARGVEHGAGDGREQRRPEPDGRGASCGRDDGGLGDCQRIGRKAIQPEGCRGVGGRRDDERPWLRLGPNGANGLVGEVNVGWPGADNDPWRDADWLFCRDGKWRPVEARPQSLADGLPEGLGRVRDPRAPETEKEIAAYANATQARPEEVLRDLCRALAEAASREREAGRVEGLLPPSLLLAFVCQLAAQGWNLAQSLPLSRPQEPPRGMRMLWNHEAAASTSRQRGLVGQSTGKPANLVHLLSPLLARDAQTAWGEAIAADAEIGFPLGVGSPARIARLRGYGNAIVPQAAAAFVRAFVGVMGAADAA